MAETPFKHIPDLPSSAQRALRRNFESIVAGKGPAGFPIIYDDGRYKYEITASGGELSIEITDKLAPLDQYGRSTRRVVLDLSIGLDLNTVIPRDFNTGAGRDFNMQNGNDFNLEVGRDVNITAAHDINISPPLGGGNTNLGKVRFDQQTPASSLGKVVAKVPVYTSDLQGNSVLLGYLPIYDDITNAPAPHLEPAARLYLRQTHR